MQDVDKLMVIKSCNVVNDGTAILIIGVQKS
jgi:hypothetical protein